MIDTVRTGRRETGVSRRQYAIMRTAAGQDSLKKETVTVEFTIRHVAQIG